MHATATKTSNPAATARNSGRFPEAHEPTVELKRLRMSAASSSNGDSGADEGSPLNLTTAPSRTTKATFATAMYAEDALLASANSARAASGTVFASATGAVHNSEATSCAAPSAEYSISAFALLLALAQQIGMGILILLGAESQKQSTPNRPECSAEVHTRSVLQEQPNASPAALNPVALLYSQLLLQFMRRQEQQQSANVSFSSCSSSPFPPVSSASGLLVPVPSTFGSVEREVRVEPAHEPLRSAFDPMGQMGAAWLSHTAHATHRPATDTPLSRVSSEMNPFSATSSTNALRAFAGSDPYAAPDQRMPDVNLCAAVRSALIAGCASAPTSASSTGTGSPNAELPASASTSTSTSLLQPVRTSIETTDSLEQPLRHHSPRAPFVKHQLRRVRHANATCSLCSKCFTCPSALAIHMRTHTGALAHTVHTALCVPFFSLLYWSLSPDHNGML